MRAVEMFGFMSPSSDPSPLTGIRAHHGSTTDRVVPYPRRTMGELLGSMVVLGVITGLCPFTLACLFIVADAPRPGRNGVAFLAGDALILAVIMLIAGGVLGGHVRPSTAPATGVLIGQVFIGAALLVIGVVLWRRPTSDGNEIPAALRKLENLSAFAAFIAGAVMTMYPPAVIAASDLVSNDLDKAQRLVGVLVFFLCAIGIPAAPVAYLATSQSARDRLSEARGWLLSRRTKVGGFALVAIGATIVVKGLVSLL